MPVWVDKEVVLAIHERQLAEHGGAAGIRDEGALESALARPINLAAYDDPGISDLAAAYAFGLARNHPFVDGNKRVSEVVTMTFLLLNGYAIPEDQAQIVLTWLRIAEGEMAEDEIAAWLDEHCPRAPGSGS